jgi:putative ABC transport system permease protein
MQARLFLRLIFKNAEIYFLKIITLAVAFAALILVSIFSLNEFGYDRFHKAEENIFRVIEKNNTEDYKRNKYTAKIPSHIHSALMAENSLTLSRTKVLNELNIVTDEDSFYRQKIHVADPEITDILTFNLLNGSLEAFNQQSLILSSTAANEYFGTVNATGKNLKIYTFGDTVSYEVAAVYASFPNNSHQDFQVFLRFDAASLTALGFDPDVSEIYGRSNSEISHPNQFAKISAAANGHKTYSTQAISAIYFGPRMSGEDVEHGDLYSLIILISITSLILFLAFTSFINLTILALPHRVKELAVKKLAGDNKLSLTISFLGESLLLALISFVLGIVILWACWEFVPDTQVIAFPALIQQEVIALPCIVAGFILLLVFAPLLMTRRFIKATPIRLLSAEAITFPRFKKVIIILQLGVSIFLIISSIVINRQVTYSLVKEPGRNNYQVVYLGYPDDLTDEKLQNLRRGWKKSRPNIVGVIASSQLPNQIRSKEIGSGLYTISVDAEFNDFFDLEIVEGAWFGPNDGDSITVVNESGFRKLANISTNVRGIYKDISSQYNQPEKPTKIVKQGYFKHNYLCVRILEIDILKTINYLERYFKAGGQSSKVQFMDKQFESWINYQIRLNSFTNILTIIAALLSCFAIYGLSISVVRDKMKQIAIRKICGADIVHIIYLLVKEFASNLLISILLFAPITYLLINELLRTFVYATRIQWLDPVYPLAYCTLVITVLCIWQALSLNKSDLSGALKE